MNKVLVMDFNLSLLQSMRNQKIVVKTDDINQVDFIYTECQKNNNVMAIIVSLPFTSISQIEFQQKWSIIPLVISAYNIGDYELFFSKVDLIRSLNIRFFLSNEYDSVFTELKILSSLGVDCGLNMKADLKMNDDSFLDLASYYYMSPAPHATIEPFEFILNKLSEERNIGFESVYFEDPLMFAKIESIEDIEQLDVKQQNNEFAIKMNHYYKHFLDLDDCSKCAAFKICDKNMKIKLNDCQKTMEEVFEYAELRSNILKNKESKTICQL